MLSKCFRSVTFYLSIFLCATTAVAQSEGQIISGYESLEAPIDRSLQYEFYNENLLLPKSGHKVTSLSLLALKALSENFKAYGGFAFTRDWNEEIFFSYADRYVAPLVGLKYSLLPSLGLRAEYRYLIRSNDGPNIRKETEGDFRLGATYYNEFFFAKFASDWTLTSDVYGESFWLPRLDNRGLYSTIWGKLLLNYPLLNRLMLSPYAELRFSRSGDIEFGTNLQEVRSGLRLAWQVSSNLSAKLFVYHGSRIQGTDELAEPDQLLLVIGGQF